jgi:hypothetical protein
VSAGAAFKVGGRAALRLNAEDYVYAARFTASGGGLGCAVECRYRGPLDVCNLIEATSPTTRFQDDLVLSVGLAIPLGDR